MNSNNQTYIMHLNENISYGINQNILNEGISGILNREYTEYPLMDLFNILKDSHNSLSSREKIITWVGICCMCISIPYMTF